MPFVFCSVNTHEPWTVRRLTEPPKMVTIGACGSQAVIYPTFVPVTVITPRISP